MLQPPYANAVFDLPGGLVVENDCIRTAALRPLCGREEEWLSENPNAPAAISASVLLNSCLSSQGSPNARDLARDLLVEDRDFLVMQLRRLTLGDRVDAVIRCPACAAKVDMQFQLDEVIVERREQTAIWHTLSLPGDATDRVARFRLPTGRDQEAIANLPPEKGAVKLFDLCVEYDDPPLLTDIDREAIMAAMESVAPEVGLELDIVCPECNQSATIPFDINTFFFEEMRGSRDQLLREVHLLALAYHWSESDILNLVRSRRRAYLRLLSDAFPRERG